MTIQRSAELDYLARLKGMCVPGDPLFETTDWVERTVRASMDPRLLAAIGTLSYEAAAEGAQFDSFVDICAEVAEQYGLSPNQMAIAVNDADMHSID
jgi:hypothetical protein